MKHLREYSNMLNDLRESYGDGAFIFTIAPYGFLALICLLQLVAFGL